MRNRASYLRRHFASVVCAGVAFFLCGANQARAATQASPVLISTSGTTRALAVESVSMRSEPFKLTSEGFFNPNDARTRIEIFCTNLDLLAGESANALTADAQDASGNRYDLKVEFVGQVPQSFDSQGNMLGDFRGIYMVVLRLNDLMPANLGDVLIRLNLHGMSSNRVRVAIGQIGGGPADDPGAVSTPISGSLPAVQTPLTIAQYQAQYNNVSFPSDADIQRFLEQSSWGLKGDGSDLTRVRQIGMAAYINEQFNTPPLFNDNSDPLFPIASDYPLTPLYPVNQPSPCDANCVRDNYTIYPLQKQFFTNAITQPDQLRQRTAFAIHQLIVASGRDLNNNEASWFAPYLQTIDRNAFGNFRTMLFDVTVNPGMGEYLNMRGNSVVNRANPTPNENYAREIMQLFSIGTDTLNQDGTPVLDAQGNRIPSYDQSTITNLARVFTGWDLAANRITNINGVDTTVTNYLDPMVPNANTARYDIAQKTLLTDINHATPVIVPACANCTNTANTQQYARDSLNTAIDNLFNHANTGPYLCKSLIRQLVTSNPSPAYVGRCAAAFANNGSGVRGDMKAVITAILLDPEARGDVKTDPNYGHLREPVLWMANMLRTFNATSDGVLATNVSGAGSFTIPLGQSLFNPPTVFSYYPADYGLPGTSLLGPEFAVLDTSTTYQRANFANTLFLANSGNGIAANPPNRPSGTQVTYANYQGTAAACTSTSSCQLVDMLNGNMMHGTMSSSMRTSIINAVLGISSSDPASRTRTAIYLVTTSSQYQIQR